MMTTSHDNQLLRRTGLRPIAFSGELLVHASHAGASDHAGYAITVFEKSDGGFVAHLAHAFGSHAHECDTIDDVHAYFNAYRPENDVAISTTELAPDDDSDLDHCIHAIEEKINAARCSYHQALTLAFGPTTTLQ